MQLVVVWLYRELGAQNEGSQQYVDCSLELTVAQNTSAVIGQNQISKLDPYHGLVDCAGVIYKDVVIGQCARLSAWWRIMLNHKIRSCRLEVRVVGYPKRLFPAHFSDTVNLWHCLVSLHNRYLREIVSRRTATYRSPCLYA
jgi:hypothetical protein